MELAKKNHSVYMLTYHIVFVVKYRRKAVSDEIGDFLKQHSAYLIYNMGGAMISAETDLDHIHILASLPPTLAPGNAVKVLKTQLSKEVHKQYGDEIKKYLWKEKSPFWTESYFIQTAGTNAMENVKKYIESQRTEEHKRKYVKSGKYKK